MIYFSFFIISAITLLGYKKRTRITQKCILFCILVAFSLLSGLRTADIGSDTSAYPFGCYQVAAATYTFSDFNNRITELYFMSEIGYKVLAYTCIKIFRDFNFFLFLCAMIVNGCFLRFFTYMAKKHNIPLWLLWLSYCCMMFNQSLNLAKQFLAIALCLLGYVFIEQNRKKLGALAIVCAMTFHFTSLAFLFIYFLKVIKNPLPRIAVITCIILTISGNYIFLSEIILRLEIFHRFAIYMVNKDGDVPIFEVFYHSLFLIIPSILYIFKKTSISKEQFINYSFLIAFEISFFMFNFISAQAGRMGLYLWPLCLTYIPIVAQKSPYKKTIHFYYAISLLAFWYITIIIQGSTCTYPYVSVL